MHSRSMVYFGHTKGKTLFPKICAIMEWKYKESLYICVYIYIYIYIYAHANACTSMLKQL